MIIFVCNGGGGERFEWLDIERMSDHKKAKHKKTGSAVHGGRQLNRLFIMPD